MVVIGVFIYINKYSNTFLSTYLLSGDYIKPLYEPGQLLGIELLDHFIIWDRTFTSSKEKGCL